MRRKEMLAVEKVTAFVTREHFDVPQILVLKHPVGDFQLPAGTVELGEAPEEAVIREVNEETGIDHAEVVSKLATATRVLGDNMKIVTRMSKIFSEPAYDSSSEGYGVTRGTPVEVLDEIGSFVEILTDPLDLKQEPPERSFRIRGYVRKSLLTSTVHRHLYHLKILEESPDDWTIFSDGLNFHLSWVPLEQTTILNEWHSKWLYSVYSKLLASHYDSHRQLDR